MVSGFSKVSGIGLCHSPCPAATKRCARQRLSCPLSITWFMNLAGSGFVFGSTSTSTLSRYTTILALVSPQTGLQVSRVKKSKLHRPPHIDSDKYKKRYCFGRLARHALNITCLRSLTPQGVSNPCGVVTLHGRSYDRHGSTILALRVRDLHHRSVTRETSKPLVETYTAYALRSAEVRLFRLMVYRRGCIRHDVATVLQRQTPLSTPCRAYAQLVVVPSIAPLIDITTHKTKTNRACPYQFREFDTK